MLCVCVSYICKSLMMPENYEWVASTGIFCVLTFIIGIQDQNNRKCRTQLEVRILLFRRVCVSSCFQSFCDDDVEIGMMSSISASPTCSSQVIRSQFQIWCYILYAVVRRALKSIRLHECDHNICDFTHHHNTSHHQSKRDKHCLF